MSDLTNVLKETKGPFEFQTLQRDRVVTVGVLDAALAGIEAIGAHNLIEVPTGLALVGAKIVILEDITSAGSATAKFTVGGKDVTAAIAKAKLVQGAVINLDLDATGDNKAYAFDEETAVTVDMTVAVAALTGGKFLVYPTYVDIKGVVENG